jgi:hypothetical protein
VTFSNGEQLTRTDSHRIWSETQQLWVALGELQLNEEVNTENDALRVIANEPVAGIADFYNIEVKEKHVYRVTQSGILVHNN